MFLKKAFSSAALVSVLGTNLSFAPGVAQAQQANGVAPSVTYKFSEADARWRGVSELTTSCGPENFALWPVEKPTMLRMTCIGGGFIDGQKIACEKEGNSDLDNRLSFAFAEIMRHNKQAHGKCGQLAGVTEYSSKLIDFVRARHPELANTRIDIEEIKKFVTAGKISQQEVKEITTQATQHVVSLYGPNWMNETDCPPVKIQRECQKLVLGK